MSKRDKIYRKRLEGIRDELDRYLDCIKWLSIPMLDVPKMVLSEFSKKLSSQLEQEASALVEEKEVLYQRKDSGRPELDKILAEKEETFSRMLLRLIDEKGLRDSEVYRRADIDRRLFSKIRSDEEYVPSKKTAISFCLALSR